jgi:hypothetical protein
LDNSPLLLFLPGDQSLLFFFYWSKISKHLSLFAIISINSSVLYISRDWWCWASMVMFTKS